MHATLAGIRVVEIGDVRDVGYAGKLLADLGAEVTRVEREGAAGSGDTLDLCLNAGKRTIADGATPETAKALLAASHIALVGSVRGKQSSMPTAEQLATEWPDLVVVSVSAFGLREDARGWAADDLSLQAHGGISIGIGLRGQPPLKLPGEQTTFQAGVCAAIAALGTLFSGRGALIDLAALDVWVSFYSGVDVALAHFGRHRKQRSGQRVSGQPYPRTILRCNDGYFAVQCGESRHWQSFLDMIGRTDLLTDPLFANRFKANDEYGDACDALVEPWFMARTKEEVLHACLEHKVPGAPVYAIDEVVAHPHLASRDYFSEIVTPRGHLKLAGDPFGSLTRAPNTIAHASAEVQATAVRRGAAQDKRRPLAGVRVVDFGWVWAGAVPGHVLADLGAEVIKVESASPLDYMRQGRPIVGTQKDPEQNPMFQNVNRGKLSLRIKLDHPQARSVITDLVATSDVVIENFSPGVMEKFGLGYTSLQRARPDLVMCSISAVGQNGPLRGIRTYATMIASLAGLDGLVGYAGGRVLGSQSSYADPNASLHAALGILAALWRRRQTGLGAYIDLSQWEAAVSVMAAQVAEYAMHGSVPRTCGTRHPGKAPHGHYPACGQDIWIAISVACDEQWQKLANVFDHPSWMAEATYATQSGRLAHGDALDRKLAQETSAYEAAALAAKLVAAGIAAAPVLDARALAQDTHVRARALFETVEHPVLGAVPVYRLPWHIDRTPIPITRRAPLLGEHNQYVLQDLLGYSRTRVDELEGAGLFA
jgi:crotonobetainyl-CoA:carnitine CoA-transferase CaiB-like acyl-CoA transferase